MVGHLDDITLTRDEEKQASQYSKELDHVRCRICRLHCEPCPVGVPIGTTLGTDVIYDHYHYMILYDRSNFDYDMPLLVLFLQLYILLPLLFLNVQ